jgi:hypothetical protein
LKNLIKIVCLLVLSISFAAPASSQSKDANVPDTVKIGTYIVSIHDIDFREKEYTARFWMWMLYDNPEFDFINQLEVPNAKTMERPDMMVDTINGLTWVLMKMKCIMKQSWEIADYPFDDQELHLHVENTMFDSRSLIFKADTAGSKYDPNLTVDGWDVTDFKVNTGVTSYPTAFGDTRASKQFSEYANFNISMKLERSAWGLFLKLFIGMYIAFFISLVSFVIEPHNVEPRFGLPVGGLFAAVGNKYIIDSILPENTSFTLVDSLHSITFLFIFFTIATSAVSLNLLTKGDAVKAKKFDRRGAIAVLGAYILINIILIGMAIIH